MDNEPGADASCAAPPFSDDEILLPGTGMVAMRAAGSPVRRNWQEWVTTVAWATRVAGVTPGTLLQRLKHLERKIEGTALMVGLGLARGPHPGDPFIMATMSGEDAETCVECLRELYASTFRAGPVEGIRVIVPPWSDAPWRTATVPGPVTVQ